MSGVFAAKSVRPQPADREGPGRPTKGRKKGRIGGLRSLRERAAAAEPSCQHTYQSTYLPIWYGVNTCHCRLCSFMPVPGDAGATASEGSVPARWANSEPLPFEIAEF